MQVPVTLSIDLPDLPASGGAPVAGPPGPMGPMGPAGAGVDVGDWLPVIGGAGGESGQAYHYQIGHYVKCGRFVQWWAYTQFTNQGAISGNLVVKGLPFATATVGGFFGGGCSYSSNLSPEANDLTAIDVWTSGARRDWNLFGRRVGQNPRPLVLADVNLATQLILHGSYYTD